jgi:hypothetical protein
VRNKSTHTHTALDLHDPCGASAALAFVTVTQGIQVWSIYNVPYYYIRKYRIREPEALYSAVTNGGSTLEGYYKTKFGLS